MKKYLSIAKTNFLNSINYFNEFIFKAIFILLILFIFTNLWKTLYTTNELIVGFSLAMMIWYLLMTESIVTSAPTLIKEVNREIQSGDVAYQLNKPYSYVLYHLARSISQRVVSFFITFFIGSIIVFLMVGTFIFNLANILPVLLVVFLAFVLDFVMVMSIALLAFWFEDTNAFKWVYDKIVFTLGGMLVPLEIFPLWLTKISAALPFSFVAYYPAKIFISFNLETFITTISVQLIYIILFGLILFGLYNKGVRRLNVNGG